MNRYINLHCINCDYVECTLCPIGTYVSIDSKRGCVREVSEDLYIKYNNNMNEILPFLNTYKHEYSKKIYQQIINDNYKVYNSPVKKIINNHGSLLNPPD